MTVAVAALLAFGLTAAPVDIAQAKKSGAAAAEPWVALVDAGKYEEAYGEASPVFKSGTTPTDWKKALDDARKPLGPLASRKLQTCKFSETLPGAPDGHYVVVTYHSEFEKKKDATETVVTSLDSDGKWKTSGYWVK